MKICHFVSYSAGSEYFTNLGMGLDDKGIDLVVGTLFESGGEMPEWIADRPDVGYFCLGARSKYDFPSKVFELASFLRRWKPDIIQTHLYEASLIGLLAARLARVPHRILTRHHLDQAHVIGKKLAIAVDKWEARTADRVVVLSNAVKEFMVSAEGIAADKITVIHQGFDFEKFSANEAERLQVRSEFTFSDDAFVVGTFGNFFPTKGHRFLIEAAADLKEKIPNLRFFFVGDGGDKEALRTQVSNAGLEENVVFAGFRRDVSACMRACDVVVHPSLSEAFCQVLIESMSTGVPLVSTDVGGAREVITDAETGLLIPASDAAAICTAVLRLHDDAGFARTIAKAGQESVRTRFTVDKMIDKQIKVYEALMRS